VLGDGVRLTTGGNGQTTAFSGPISGNGRVDFVGTGAKYLHGTNTYTGPTNVAGGTVGITGSLASATTVTNGARLAIYNGGTAAAVTSTQGIVSPGWIGTRRTVHSGA